MNKSKSTTPSTKAVDYKHSQTVLGSIPDMFYSISQALKNIKVQEWLIRSQL